MVVADASEQLCDRVVLKRHTRKDVVEPLPKSKVAVARGVAQDK